ncbi:Predicted glycosyl hydrolase, GH43/DUF377 family [Catalinimonas alkaloidigena]|uniref:Predicted glycosyl hydrolase, GH43/DUF377 family n=1 Tax=Catalinimonas alkaloidigena TaxID=1075417 RepID=A0A1G9AKD0_9BACT|nr:glycoside hydrolase family 130 protein [Catalinimonas alkaloidigena]SDK26975.1 Predicted glycosyl hydrolase, GH43/DUF377 family [Catalinimonas alkaloidigena]
MRYTTYFFALLLAGCRFAPAPDTTTATETWQLTGFAKVDAANPVMEPDASLVFYDSLRGDSVQWALKDVFNPAAVVRHDTLFLLFRAEDTVGRHAGTSRIGLAASTDGLHFVKRPSPVLYPADDALQPYEGEGGCEDPRIVEDEAGRYYLTYTSYDGETARLCVATSPDLVHWQKQGLAFSAPQYRNLWGKSGAIVCRREGSRLIATQLQNRYWMYWGDTDLYLATSPDLIHWTPLEADSGLVSVLSPRPQQFDSRLVESGPPALLTDRGIVLIYNSMNLAPDQGGAPHIPEGTYAAGQALFDAENPAQLLERADTYFLYPEAPYEVHGQVGRVCFAEGLVPYKGYWFLYYGTADSKIAVARAPLPE